MRILVTGASGLLGLNLALCASTETGKDHIVFGQVNRHLLRSSEFTVLRVDLRTPGAVERLLDQTQPDWVINCAALALLDACEADPALARQLNIYLPAKLAAYVGRGGARLLHISTDAVFDGQRGNYTELDLPNPLSVYAQTKLEGERAVSSANPDAIIARVNFFGWSLSGKRSLAEFFINNLQAGNVVPGFSDVYFCPLLVNDLALILFKILERGFSGVYHVVASECVTKYEFGIALARRFGFETGLVKPVSAAHADWVAPRSLQLTLRNDKVAQALGEPLPGLSPGIDRLFELYQQGYPEKIKGLEADQPGMGLDDNL